jgi:hypothetical protein
MTHCPHPTPPAGRRPLRAFSLRPLAFALLATVGAGAAAAPVTLAPQHAGQYASGNGANANFVQIDGHWRGSSVRWNETDQAHGSGQAVGKYPWGTGLWGRADWETVQQAAQLTTGEIGKQIGAQNGKQNAGQAVADTDEAQPLRILERWAGTVQTINHANASYNSTYSKEWGAAELVPFFADKKPGEQENWTAHFTGFIRIVEAGLYDFSVLNDDGFFLGIVGAEGRRIETGRDFLNPRDRNGFDDELELDVGLYGFELGQWNRLETGVVDLRWRRSGSDEWALVPTAHLLTGVLPAQPVPEPGSAWLAGVALAALLLRRSRRGREQEQGPKRRPG